MYFERNRYIFEQVKLLAKIFLVLATSMLLVHNFMPHQHRGSFTNSIPAFTQQKSDALLQKIILGFHTNLGQGHLENYEAKDHGHDLLTFDFPLILPFVMAAFNFFYSLLFASAEVFLPTQPENSYSSCYLNIPALRGPPVLV